jgi:hypothetical protein
VRGGGGAPPVLGSEVNTPTYRNKGFKRDDYMYAETALDV